MCRVHVYNTTACSCLCVSVNSKNAIVFHSHFVWIAGCFLFRERERTREILINSSSRRKCMSLWFGGGGGDERALSTFTHTHTQSKTTQHTFSTNKYIITIDKFGIAHLSSTGFQRFFFFGVLPASESESNHTAIIKWKKDINTIIYRTLPLRVP